MGKSNKIKKAIEEENGDPYKVGTVLFSSGDSKHADVWDDSDLIDHWDRTVEAYRSHCLKQSQSEEVAPPFQQSKRKTREGHIQKKKPVLRKKQINVHQNYSAHVDPTLEAHTQSDQLPDNNQQPTPEIPYHNINEQSSMPSMPPMPSLSSSSGQEELSNLMMAWYYCGYYTGLYQAQQRK